MPVAVNLTESDVFEALRGFLLAVLPTGTEVIRAQVNRVPAPKGDDYVIMNSAQRMRLETNVEEWDKTASNPTNGTVADPTKVMIQCDAHGPSSADNAWIIATLFRSAYACSYFANLSTAATKPITPLTVDEPKQIPFINGAQQYENRWVVNLELQANVIVTVSQEFAAALKVGLIDVDAVYPPT